MPANEIRDKGIEIANKAVSYDQEGQYEQAIQTYMQAVEHLMTAAKYEKNPITKKSMQEKCNEYVSRAESLKTQLAEKNNPKKGVKAGGGGDDHDDDDDDDDGEEPEPLTEEALQAAEKEMEEELAKLVGMESVKTNMRKLCKQLSLDIKRRNEKFSTLDSIRHMMFTGNPGVGKTTVSRLVARLYKQLGVASKETVVEVQKGDLVAGYVNQTSIKTAKKIKEARGGILFVDEAYQLTQALQRGQSDFSGEAIDEMMKVMNDTGRKATTFVFAGYKKEMDEFVQYNAGLESRIKYRFHFDDYTVPELVTIINIKMKSKGYKMEPAAQQSIEQIIKDGTSQELRSKYNGRLTDNLLQWASDEMNTRLSLDASGDQLITLSRSDFANAIKRFTTTRPPIKVDPSLMGGEEVEKQLKQWGLGDHAPLFVRAGFRTLYDLSFIQGEKEIRSIGVTKEADVRKAAALVNRLQQEKAQQSMEMDALYIDPDEMDIKTWLDKRGLVEFVKVFEKHRIDFEVLGDLTYDDIKEIGIGDVGPRRKIFRAITQWKDERDTKKADAIVKRMHMLGDTSLAQTANHQASEQGIMQRVTDLRKSGYF